MSATQVLSIWIYNFYAEYIMRNTGLEEAQAGIKIAGRNINMTERLTLTVASFDSFISSFFICKYKNMTSISESL